ncbi:MAG: FAD-dependent thymidylate synthase [Geitlerinemataceae cyanobacterium]
METLASTPNPQRLVHLALHQDYSADPVADWQVSADEQRSGEITVQRLLKGDRGHYGCLEHPQITLNAIGFPHAVMQQARTHRVGVSFDVQSFRYTSASVLEVARGDRPVEDVFYFRPVGEYRDRDGARYTYTEAMRQTDIDRSLRAAKDYLSSTEQGLSEEHARDVIPFCVRQHFVVSFNLRSALHFLDLRYKANAQLEIQQLAWLIWLEVQKWAPEISAWYEDRRLGKAKLSP